MANDDRGSRTVRDGSRLFVLIASVAVLVLLVGGGCGAAGYFVGYGSKKAETLLKAADEQRRNEQEVEELNATVRKLQDELRQKNQRNTELADQLAKAIVERRFAQERVAELEGKK